ncbi:AAA family ATPase [Methylocystis parvus]|uniref:AAA family ATPase n=1 Tax=Methylocystis parvus TaxID=134 RepID=UPI003C786F3B
MPQNSTKHNTDLRLNVAQRRLHNRELAIRLAASGIAIFPSSGKVPLIPGWPQLDSSMRDNERADAIARYQDEHDRTPSHVGATIDADTIKRLWREFPDAVPSISCGPSGLLVLDADSKRDGPANLMRWAASAGVDLSTAPVTETQSGGLHVFLSNDAAHGCAAGAFHDMGIDVRAVGGQVIAPGAIREDGRRYAPKAGAPELDAAYVLSAISPIPAPVREMLAKRPKPAQGVSAQDERAAVDKLATQDWPDFADMTDETIGKFDLDALAEKDAELRKLLVTPGDDHSDNRFNFAKCLHREYGDAFDVLDFAALIEHFNDELDGAFGAFVGDETPEQGEFSLRSIARDYLRSKACPSAANPISNGDAFGIVEDIDDYLPSHVIEARERRKEEREATKRPLIVLDGEADEAWTPVDYFVEGVIPQKSIGIFFGPPGAFKSFAAIDLASHIARGREWQGLRTERAGVVYWHGEGQAGVAGRFRAWRRAYGGEGGAVGLADADLNFMSPKVEDKLRKIIAAYEGASGQKCGLFIVDTLSKAALGMESNADKEAAMVLRHAELAARNLGVTILFIAHTGKDEQRGVRGSSAFEGNVDFRLKMEKGGKLTIERMKDGAKRAPLPLKTKAVEIGTNKHGEALTSLVIIPPAARCDVGAVEDNEDTTDLGPAQSSPQAPAAHQDGGANLSERQRRVLDLARDLCRPFTATEMHAAHNRAWGRKDKPLGVDTIRRCLQTLRDAYLVYNEYEDTSLNRWALIQDAEGTSIQGSQ